MEEQDEKGPTKKYLWVDSVAALGFWQLPTGITCPEAQHLLEAISENYGLSDEDQALLAQACRSLEVANQCHQKLMEQGCTVPAGSGGEMGNPANSCLENCLVNLRCNGTIGLIPEADQATRIFACSGRWLYRSVKGVFRSPKPQTANWSYLKEAGPLLKRQVNGGSAMGRPTKLTPDQQREGRALLSQGFSTGQVAEIARGFTPSDRLFKATDGSNLSAEGAQLRPDAIADSGVLPRYPERLDPS